MSYGASLLWFVFIALSTAAAFNEAFRTPVYFPEGRTLFPDWPVWHPQWALTLLGTTAIILFMPKLFSILLILLKKDQARQYGGSLKLLASLVLEVFLSALFAPVRMLFHSKFVFITLLGRRWVGVLSREVTLEPDGAKPCDFTDSAHCLPCSGQRLCFSSTVPFSGGIHPSLSLDSVHPPVRMVQPRECRPDLPNARSAPHTGRDEAT